jgi:hypothetical protein
MKETLQRELESLNQTREELRLQASLARADAQKEWAHLEKQFHLAQEELARLGAHAKSATHEAGERARGMLDELKAGYERIRNAT